MAPVIDAPGIYPDLPEAEYHADNLAPSLGRSLSSTGAKAILKCPALYRYERDNPRTSDAFDFGSAAHAMVLGKGPQIVTVDAPDWRRAEARAQRDEIRAAGQIPVLAVDMARIETLAMAVNEHPTASEIFGAPGMAEVSMYWVDEGTGVTCRGRIDWQTPVALVDLKTTIDAGQAFEGSAARFGYYQQAEWYSRGWRALTGQELPSAIVAVEKEPPYLVAVWWLDDPAALDWAAQRNDQALALYAQCESDQFWPGYPDQTLTLPPWAMKG